MANSTHFYKQENCQRLVNPGGYRNGENNYPGPRNWKLLERKLICGKTLAGNMKTSGVAGRLEETLNLPKYQFYKAFTTYCTANNWQIKWLTYAPEMRCQITFPENTRYYRYYDNWPTLRQHMWRLDNSDGKRTFQYTLQCTVASHE